MAGLAEYNDQQLSRGPDAISYLAVRDLVQFAVDVAENWQSEYLQFLLYILDRLAGPARIAGVEGAVDEAGPRVRRGAEGRRVRRRRLAGAGRGRGGWRTALYSRSLGLVMGVIFLLSWLAQSIAGRAAYNAEQLEPARGPVSWGGYVGSADFWNRTLQNWQSEFLAVARMVVLSIYLRQRGSPSPSPWAPRTRPPG